ncbi:MAG TPA: hypothetical protein VMQ52_02740 [Candidatus Saccharimonadales bacterium]|jgi:RsiW-degrading membrane proteinase PrsW (M82 family)|nr:hypothetical protein [Candidatus Saccharimonadales bacterium]
MSIILLVVWVVVLVLFIMTNSHAHPIIKWVLGILLLILTVVSFLAIIAGILGTHVTRIPAPKIPR